MADTKVKLQRNEKWLGIILFADACLQLQFVEIEVTRLRLSKRKIVTSDAVLFMDRVCFSRPHLRFVYPPGNGIAALADAS